MCDHLSLLSAATDGRVFGIRMRFLENEARLQKLARLRELRADFAHLHRIGMDALERRDFSALSAAIKAEAEIIQEQRRLLQHLRLGDDRIRKYLS